MQLVDGELSAELREHVHQWALAFAREPELKGMSFRQTPPCPDHAGPSPTTWPRPSGSARHRILLATAATVRQKGYAMTTVADIVSAAALSRRLFYNEFRSKAEAFSAAFEYGYERAVAACAPAFFCAGSWPERVWDCGLAFTRFLGHEPLLTYLGFVECFSPGRDFVRRVHDRQGAFRLFLEEGYRQRDEARRLPLTYSTLTGAVILESRLSRRSASSQPAPDQPAPAGGLHSPHAFYRRR